MKTLLLAGIGIVLLVGAVLLLRRRQRSLKKQIPSGPPQTRSVEDLVHGDSRLFPSPGQAEVVHGMEQPQPMGPQERRQMLRYLKSSYDKGSKARLAAMEDMVAWGHPACLPLLRRGLRDADLRVVGLAARGLERFRGPRQRLAHPLRHPSRRPHHRSRGANHPSKPV